MAVPKYFELYRSYLWSLRDKQPHTIKEIREEVAKREKLTNEDMKELLPSKRQTVFANRVGWAGTYLLKAGLIERCARATFVITQRGIDVMQNGPELIDDNYLLRFDSFKQFKQPSLKSDEGEEKASIDEADTPDDTFETAFVKIRKGLQDDLLSEVMKLSPTAFEQMVLDLMAKMGYGTFENASKTTAASGDEGIDGIIMEDKLGFNLIYVQAKKWAEDHVVGRPEVQAFVGAIAGKGGQGLYVTTSHFSQQAKDYAAKQHIILMDGDKLTDNMIEHNFGVTVRKVFEIKTIDTDIFNDYSDQE